MKRRTLMITFVSVAAFAVGCKHSEEEMAAPNREATAQQIDKLTREANEAAQDMTAYANAEESEFVEKMQSRLTRINRDLQRLSAKAENASEAAESDAKPKLEALRVQVAELNKQLVEAKNATKFTWENMTDGFNLARQWVSDKIAP